MERKKVLTAVVLLGLLCAAVAQAELYVPTAFGNGADGWISNDNQSSSYWSDKVHNTTGMQARYNGGGSRFRATFLRFDISGVSDPFAADTKLQLNEIFAKGSAKTLQVYGLTDNDTDDNWTDTTLCYDNAPGFVTPSQGNNLGWYAIDDRLTLLGTFAIPAAPAGTPSGGGTVNVRIWSNPTLLSLADFLNADTNGLVTLVLINATGTSSNNSENRFASEEDAVISKAPALVPEPATMLILGLGSLMAVRRKRS